jgi:hypothetical protein
MLAHVAKLAQQFSQGLLPSISQNPMSSKYVEPFFREA